MKKIELRNCTFVWSLEVWLMLLYSSLVVNTHTQFAKARIKQYPGADVCVERTHVI